MPKDNSSRKLLAGLDECGTGCLAGPVTVAVAVFPTSASPIAGVRDSKALSPSRRAQLIQAIFEAATYVGIGWASPQSIDTHGLRAAWQTACEHALLRAPTVDKLMIDGIVDVASYRGRQETIVKGDAKVWQISAASVVAKVARDTEMASMASLYPLYGWEQNAGYGTSKHTDALKKYGPCAFHRKSFLTKLLQSA
jgi:ribonuclease HII